MTGGVVDTDQVHRDVEASSSVDADHRLGMLLNSLLGMGVHHVVL
jgi:hypothetical protein